MSRTNPPSQAKKSVQNYKAKLDHYCEPPSEGFTDRKRQRRLAGFLRKELRALHKSVSSEVISQLFISRRHIEPISMSKTNSNPYSSPPSDPISTLRSLIQKDDGHQSPTGLFNDDGTPMLKAPSEHKSILGLEELVDACVHPGATFENDVWRHVRDLAPAGWMICMYHDFMKLFNMLHNFGTKAKVVPYPHTILSTWTDSTADKKTYQCVEHGALDFEWRGVQYRAINTQTFSKDMGDAFEDLYFISTESAENLSILFADLHSFTVDIQDTILVFKGGWTYSEEIRESVKGFSWDDIILPEERKTLIRDHVNDFFKPATRNMYEEMGVPYKRGFLLAGPPGCGKSLIAKIIANSTPGVAFIYVISLRCPSMSEEGAIEEIFRKARENAPSIVCFEDLDSQLDLHTRTTFLNAMDGFEPNDGVLTIATTNNPDQIDPALVNRPSRFDNKWVFAYPEAAERERYLVSRIRRACRFKKEEDKLPSDIAAKVSSVAQQCRDFSYAMLQELAIGVGFRLIKDFDLGKVAKYLDETYKQCSEQVKLGKASEIKNQMKADKPKDKSVV